MANSFTTPTLRRPVVDRCPWSGSGDPASTADHLLLWHAPLRGLPRLLRGGGLRVLLVARTTQPRRWWQGHPPHAPRPGRARRRRGVPPGARLEAAPSPAHRRRGHALADHPHCRVRTTATCSGAAYECWLPLPKKKLIPMKLNHRVAIPTSATIAAERPFHPDVARACR